ncbi:MAG: magnesium transporter [Candidatus Latescibacteria bacterium]|nr:magnesium transporter [Candidatus Latescibacterota bacterium]
MIGKVLQPDLEELIQRQNWGELRGILSDLEPFDIAEIIGDLPPEDKGVVFRVLPHGQAAEVFAHLPFEHQEELIQSLSGEQMRAILNQMTPDDRTRLLEELPSEVTRRLLETLSPEELKAARELLGYPPDTAGRYMTPEYVSLRPDMTAAQALDHIRRSGRGKETLDIVYVVDQNGKLLDDLRLGVLVLADPAANVGKLQDQSLVSVPATADREEALQTFEKYDRVALPVTDAQGHMLGILTVDDILDVAQQEATEDIQKIGGQEALDAPYPEVGFLALLRKRAGWLSVLFLGEMFTATAMGYFEQEIERAVVLALFVPLIISSGGNSGSQAATLIIRSLALGELSLRDWLRVFGRELASGLSLGVWLGLIGFLRVILWQRLGWVDYGEHYALVGITVWISLVGVVSFGTLAGSMLPFILRRLKFDPATSSAPFVATLVDVTGLVIYFTVAYLVLRGALL